MVKEKLNQYILDILKDNGWHDKRNVDIQEWIDILTKEGYVLNHHAISILHELGNLNIRTKGDEQHYGISVYFNPVHAASGEYDRLEIFNAVSGEELFPIGECFDWIVYIGNSGKIYLGDWKSLSVIGESIEDFLNTIVNPNSKLIEIYP